MKKIIILFALILTGCVEAKEETVCNPTIEYVEVIKYVEVDNIIIETEYIEKLIKVPYETIKEVIVEVPVEVIVYETITKTKTKTEYVYIETIVEVSTPEYIYVKDYETLVFVGDSITYEFDLPFQDNDTLVFNRGFIGYPSDLLIPKIPEIVSLLPDKIFIMLGTNDIRLGYTYEETMDYYSQIINEFITALPQVEIYLQSILPASEYIDRSLELTNSINSGLQEIAYTNSGITYIDLHILYDDENGYMIEEYTKDGIHLTELGYSVWIEELKKHGIDFK
jgi:hypothetical protein